jgi:predicted nuclease of predicted toxin-antitoxin system
MKFVIDEDIARSTGGALVSAGFEVLDIRDHGLRGSSDDAIFRFAQAKRAVLLTGDMGFGNLLRYPLGRHHGILIARFPNEMPVSEVNRHILLGLDRLKEEDVMGNLIILEPGKVRIRRQ